VKFPHESVPDGAVFGPHHLYIGLMLALLALAVVWDDRAGVEPWVGSVGLLAGLFAFAIVWPFYPSTGAILALSGVLVTLASVFLPFWTSYAWLGPRGALLLGTLIALDDVVEHAFGVPTPLDWLWKAHIVQHIH
jgi:hypothetical protein